MAQALFLVGVADEGGLHQHGRHVRRAQHGEVGLLDAGLVQPPDLAQLGQHALGQHLAVADLRGGVEIHQQAGGLGGAGGLDVDAPDQVGTVLVVGQPFGTQAGCPMVGQHEDRRAAGIGLDEGVGVNGDEEVCPHAARLADALAQRHVVVVVAGQHHAQVLFLGQQLLHLVGHGQHHGLLVRAHRAGGAGVLTAMARIQHHGESACHFRGGGFPAGGRRGLALAGLFRATGGLAVVCLAVGVGDQLLQRVDRMLGIQVQHQPVLVAGSGLEREHLRRHGLLQVEDDAQGFGVELTHAHLTHEGIAGADLAQQFAHLRFHLQPFQVQDDPIGVVNEAGTERYGLGQLEGDAGVFA